MSGRGKGELKSYFYVGLVLIAGGEVLVFSPLQPLVGWAYLFFWYGYILFLDGMIYYRKGRSLINDHRKEFYAMLPISTAVWLLFEWYNLHLENWHYVNLPPQWWVALIGFVVSFATVVPGVFLTSELLEEVLKLERAKVKPRKFSRGTLAASVVFGGLCLTVPPVIGSSYLFGFVWVGFVFLLDPINYWLGGESLLGDLARGRLGRALGLFLGGTMCGFLWEFWNYWGYTKWVYDVPITSDIKLFEMPVLGYLGFPAFALELFDIYASLKLLYSFMGRTRG